MRSSIALALPLVSLLLASRPPAATLSSSLEKDGEPLFRPFELRLADALLYDEPPAWQVPPRHALGAVLLADQRFAEALAVYEEDLLRYPENGWSLYGLSQALQGLKRTEEAAAALRRFQQAWSRADIQIASSCLCVEKKRADRSTPAKLESIPLPTP